MRDRRSLARDGRILSPMPACGLKLSAVAAAVGLLLNGPAIAQQQQGGQQNQLEEVTVTGTRIQQTSTFQTPVPVTAVTTQQLNNYAPATTIADQLSVLPQFFMTESAQRGGGALFGSAGVSSLDLRGMGPQRTLVLLDGSRMMPADINGTVNIDNFPTALLQSVQVVTGGASAAYGADAIAGVTNFVLNHNYQGLDVSVRGGQTTAGDGQNHKFTLAFGTDLGSKWHMIGSVEDQQIAQIQRDPTTLGSYWQRWGLVTNPAWTGRGDVNHAEYLVLPQVNSTINSPTGAIQGGFTTDANGVDHPAALPASLQNMQFTYDGKSIMPFTFGSIVGANHYTSGGPQASIDNQSFTGGPYGAQVKRRNLYTGFTFRPSDRFTFSADILGGRTESNNIDVRGNPGGSSPWYYTIYRENPFLPPVVRQAMYDAGLSAIKIYKKGQVLGQAGNYEDHVSRFNSFKTYLTKLGIDKKLFDKWDMKVTVQRGVTDKLTEVPNELRVDKEFLAFDTVSVDPNTGQVLGLLNPATNPQDNPANGVIECNVQRVNPTPAQLAASVANVRVPAPQGDRSLATSSADLVPIPGPIGPDAIAGCTPLNVLGQGNVSAQAQAYISSMKAGISAVVQKFDEVLFNNPSIFKGIGSAGPFSMAAGATYRNQYFWQRGLPVALMAYGPPLNEPSLGIRGIPPGFTGGSANLHEFSTVPVLNGGYDVWETYAEFNLPLWAKGSRDLSIDLAGRYSDYSTTGGINSWKTSLNFDVAKPLRLRGTASRDVREPDFAERFNLQGGGGQITDNRPGYPGVSEITVTSGGNPNLAPEEANTITAGFVYQPTRVPALQVSLDTYRISLFDAVGQLGQQQIVNGCQLGNNQSLCALIRYDSTGAIQNVDNVYLNIANRKVRGNDLEVQFNATPHFFKNQSQSLSMRVLAGELLEDSYTNPGLPTIDNAGMYYDPKWSAIGTVNYQIGSFGVDLQQRYVPKTQNQVVFGQRLVQFQPGVSPGADASVDNNTIQSKMYTNLSFYWQQQLSNGHTWRTSLEIQNLFDRDPPVVPSVGQRGGTQSVPSSGQYDLFGRQISLSFDYRL